MVVERDMWRWSMCALCIGGKYMTHFLCCLHDQIVGNFLFHSVREEKSSCYKLSESIGAWCITELDYKDQFDHVDLAFVVKRYDRSL